MPADAFVRTDDVCNCFTPRAEERVGLLSVPVEVLSEVPLHDFIMLVKIALKQSRHRSYKITLYGFSPRDLLHLARTARYPRDMLISKQSQHIWQAAIEHVGAPACPENICEPAYASLLYDEFCQKCDSLSAQRTNFSFNHRLCERCYDETVQTGQELLHSYLSSLNMTEDEDDMRIIFSMVPNAAMQFTLHNPLLLSIEGSRRAGGLISRRKFIKEQFQEVFSEYLAKRSDPVALEQCIRMYQAECLRVAEYAKAVGSWYAKYRTFCH